MAAYIEREVVLKILKSHPCGKWRGIAMCYSDEIKAAMKDIESLPAAKVAPERHGKWVHDHYEDCSEQFEIVGCTNCGHKAYAMAVYVMYGNFCPNCGAKMDLKEGGEE